MQDIHKRSSAVLLGLIFLLPVFFLPASLLSLPNSKLVLVVVGIIATALLLVVELYKSRKLSIPKHYFMWSVLALPLVYLVSALATDPTSLSLFGYNFEAGTFGFLLLVTTLLVLIISTFTSSARVFQGVLLVALSLSLITVWTLVKVVFGGHLLSFGVFEGNMANAVGQWTDLAILLGIVSILALLALKTLPVKKPVKITLWAVFLLATALMFLINFVTALVLLVVVSAFFTAVFFKNEHKMDKAYVILVLLALILVINPTISQERGRLGDVLSNTFEIQNTDVRPSFSTTLDISRAALSQNTLLGSGPNTFGRDWLVYKPTDVNATPFWGVSFPFGIGFIPTQISSTGLLGVLAWISFFVLLVSLWPKALKRLPENKKDRFTVLATLSGSAYLWLASFVYVPSAVVLILAFVLTGFFIATLRSNGLVSSQEISLGRKSRREIINTAVGIVVLALVLCGVSPAYNRIASAYHFQKSVEISNDAEGSLEDVKANIEEAISISPLDVYYGALARVNFAKAQLATENTERTPEENGAEFSEAMIESINAAKMAVDINPKGYNNWVLLASIYSALTLEPLSVDGAYESARITFAEALQRNPNTPEVPLLLARLEANLGNAEEARRLAQEALKLKGDYLDAHFLIAQLEIQANNLPEAIKAAEAVAFLSPQNPGIFFELGLMKYLNTDYRGAAEAMIVAISLVPDYANARYYLGLSLARLGENALALEQFETVSKTNPDNAELNFIIEELRAGNDLFSGGLFR